MRLNTSVYLIQLQGYKNYLSNRQLADESEYVKEICSYAGNIEGHYLASEGRSSLAEINDRIKILEQPYKAIANSYWVNEIYRMAASMDIGVLLSGQSGNATVSWGNFHLYAMYLLKTGRFNVFSQEIKAYSRLKKTNPVRICLRILFDFMPYGVRKINYALRGGIDLHRFFSPINGDFYKVMKVGERLKKYNIDPLLTNWTDSFGARRKMLSQAAFSHLSAIETKTSLAFGVENRDPTRDKRVIEFCINLPENQWVRDGKERRFIRSAMKGYMPDQVRLNTTVRGRQAADWIQRMKPEWDKIWKEIATIGENELERKYLDIPRIKHFLNENKELKDNDNGMKGIILLIRALIFTRFLRSLDLQE